MCYVCWPYLPDHVLLVKLHINLQDDGLAICVNVLNAVAPISTEKWINYFVSMGFIS